MRFTADVGAFIRRQVRKGCAYDLGTLDMPWALVSDTDDIFSSLGGNVFENTSVIVFLCLVGPVLPRGKFVICVESYPGFIHSGNFIIYLIPILCHLCFLQVVLDPLETTITVMVAPIIMMMMLRESAVRNNGSRWALEMMMLSVKNPARFSVHHYWFGFTSSTHC